MFGKQSHDEHLAAGDRAKGEIQHAREQYEDNVLDAILRADGDAQSLLRRQAGKRRS